jgi:hypothetical protein
MSEKSERLYKGITNVDDDLIQELHVSPQMREVLERDVLTEEVPVQEVEVQKTTEEEASVQEIVEQKATKYNHSSPRRRWCAAAAVAALLVVIGVAGSVAVKIRSGGETADNLDTKMGGSLDTVIGKKEDNACTALTAEEITEADIDCSGLEKLEKEIQKKADYGEIKESVAVWIADGTEGFLLTDAGNLAVSTCSMPMINLSDLSVSEVVYEFLFAEEQPVGYIQFFMGNGSLNHNTSLLTPQTHSYFLDFLAEHPGESFLVLSDGMSCYFLGEDNVLYRASNGTGANELTIDGDCYHAFPYEKMAVSYEKIMSQVVVIGE